jgi:Uma2 family endonuclease
MGMAIATERFSIADLDALPDDGLHRELLDGVVLVNPLAGYPHQVIAARCVLLLGPFVKRLGLGTVVSPGRLVVGNHTALEPDVMVLPASQAPVPVEWERLPAPLLVIEVVSASSRRIDYLLKRESYATRGAAEYWIVDLEQREVLRVRPGFEDEHCSGDLTWSPRADVEALVVAVPELFAGF